MLKSERREQQRNKRKNGMRITGRSVFIIQEAIINRADKTSKKKRGKK
jgi:hypothetical protein